MAFEAMRAQGLITHLMIYSPRLERAEFRDYASFEADALKTVRSFQPNIIFVQHVVGTDMAFSLWQGIKAACPGISIVHHDDDPYDRLVKRMDKAMIALLQESDQVWLSGLGRLADLFRRHSDCPVHYLPSCFDTRQFVTRDPTLADKKFDIVTIGNRGVRRRIKFLYVPGGRRRALFCSKLSRMYGTRYGLFGNGWEKLPSAQGPVAYAQQEATLQSGRITANWDHFDTIEYYFSDRLPISLAAGVPHVTSWHPGYDQMFAQTPGFYACKSPEEAIDTCRWLLSRRDEDLLEEGLAAKAWALSNMDAVASFTTCMMRAIQLHDERSAS